MLTVSIRRVARSLGTWVAALAFLFCLGAGAGSARAQSPCPHAGVSVWRASSAELRAAVVCLVNHLRARRGLPPVFQQRQLDAAAQAHSDAMVSGDFFGHGDPASRISAAGFDWGTYGEAISTGYRTPWSAVAGWLASTYHCQLLLSPTYRFVGVGVNPRGVFGWTANSGTWTLDLALPLGWSPPSGNWAPAGGCPY